ncbi:MAG TPA: sugar transferase [Patescibacteria group bacterium]|nr:sugar transferase [Patescibacteria group bacterium]
MCLIERFITLILIVICLPIWVFLFILVKTTSRGPFIFKQIRAGKNKKPFIMYKIRTMVYNAEKLKKKYIEQNEADGPIFKIKNDPRFTIIGGLLSKSGIDETPQFINILKGEMTLVGPRPFPIDEAIRIPKKYEKRFSVLPGMTSVSVSNGAHKISFNEWMEQDLDYIKKKSIKTDVKILALTLVLISQHLKDK